MQTNFLSIVRLNEKLLPLLRGQPEAAIVNVSSIVAFVPGARLATYAASKAALHSYTQSLRFTLSDTNVKVFELMPPLVDMEFSVEIDGQRASSRLSSPRRYCTASKPTTSRSASAKQRNSTASTSPRRNRP